MGTCSLVRTHRRGIRRCSGAARFLMSGRYSTFQMLSSPTLTCRHNFMLPCTLAMPFTCRLFGDTRHSQGQTTPRLYRWPFGSPHRRRTHTLCRLHCKAFQPESTLPRTLVRKSTTPWKERDEPRHALQKHLRNAGRLCGCWLHVWPTRCPIDLLQKNTAWALMTPFCGGTHNAGGHFWETSASSFRLPCQRRCASLRRNPQRQWPKRPQRSSCGTWSGLPVPLSLQIELLCAPTFSMISWIT